MNGDTYYDIRNLCSDEFCREKTLPMHFALVSMPTPLPATWNSVSSQGFFSTWNCSAARVVVCSVWENEYLKYSWIIFPHCSTVLYSI